jgi:UDP-N-acetylmuramoylalanine--D-glutamate ligase
MDVVLEKVRDRAIGVTGTKGKSTVASLICHILKSSGKDAVLFGNIGIADMEILKSDSPERIYVIELSSYQCEHITRSPHIAVLTNLYQEHLTHHGSFESYREAKMNIARFQKPGDVFIDGRDVQAMKPFETKLLGEHNQQNCATALSAVRALGMSEEEARKHIATFEPLPYRLEKVGEFGGITFYDDSLATIPEATLASIAALPRVDTLILGGEDRGIDFALMADALSKTSIRTFVIFPDTGAKMVAKAKGKIIIRVSSMIDAVKAAYEHTPKGGTVLLSNASPSFNLFKDYKDKSAQYRKWVQSREA